MDESAVKGLKVLPKLSDVGRITVSGYDIKLPYNDVERALRKHFSSCGEITDVCAPIDWDSMDDIPIDVEFDPKTNILERSAYIYFLGDGAVAVSKALKLNGTYVEGWNISVEAFPFPPDANDEVMVDIEGYDTWLSKIDIDTSLREHFSSYGEFTAIHNLDGYTYIMAHMEGTNIANKVLELDGSYMGGRKLSVRLVDIPGIYTVHQRPPRYRGPLVRPPISTSDAAISTSDEAIPQMRGESSNRPRNPAEKLRRLREELDRLKSKNKAGTSSVEKQTSESDGFVVEDIRVGNGKIAVPGKLVSYRYTGTLQENGKIFISIVRESPYELFLGAGIVLPGLDQGLIGMRVGGRRRLTVPPAMAYGAKGLRGKVPPDAWVVFDVELLKVREDDYYN
ncbi:uncharacterized protein LOC17882770 isoform X2 [Capsella rubella]|uniref:uncharacterized protein LOC17882770 isoform X2 n=1 Tax=Capsella rubella TaxID=81985 RepID=UPI000CD50A9C|nr:uncharacterized protein LOC17882770 isoform X2 [Capsella rubella]